MKPRSSHFIARNIVKLLSLTALAFSTQACVAAADDAELGEPTAEPEVFTRTIVTLHEDGTETVEIREVTLDEQLGDQEIRELRLNGEYDGLGTASDEISRDLSCSGASMWIFDQTNLTGNEICFIGAGIANLDNYCRTARCGGTWGQNVRSYWAGQDWGQFSIGGSFTCGSGGSTCGLFSAYQRQDQVSSCEQLAHYLGLQQLCIPA